MLNRVELHGELGEKYGKEWDLDINSPAEAIRALSANNPGFRQFMGSSESRGVGYQVIVGSSYLEDAEAELNNPLGRQTLKIIPVIAGSKSSIGKILFGALLVWVAWPVIAAGAGNVVSGGLFGGMTVSAGGFWAANMAVSMGASLVLGGVAEMLAPDIKAPRDPELSDNKDLGPVNTSMQGVPVPICYGQLMVGGAIISALVEPTSTSTYVEPSTSTQSIVGSGGSGHAWYDADAIIEGGDYDSTDPTYINSDGSINWDKIGEDRSDRLVPDYITTDGVGVANPNGYYGSFVYDAEGDAVTYVSGTKVVIEDRMPYYADGTSIFGEYGTDGYNKAGYDENNLDRNRIGNAASGHEGYTPNITDANGNVIEYGVNIKNNTLAQQTEADSVSSGNTSLDGSSFGSAGEAQAVAASGWGSDEHFAAIEDTFAAINTPIISNNDNNTTTGTSFHDSSHDWNNDNV